MFTHIYNARPRTSHDQRLFHRDQQPAHARRAGFRNVRRRCVHRKGNSNAVQRTPQKKRVQVGGGALHRGAHACNRNLEVVCDETAVAIR